MPSVRVSKNLNDKTYFLTFTVMEWRHIFDIYERRKILTDALRYCIENKGLKVFAFVIMPNHIHLIIQSPDVAGFIRDFKKQTAFELIKNLRIQNPKIALKFENEKGKYCIWKKTNFPKLIETDPYFRQKREYIEKNPVRKGYVEKPEHWRYSSACPDCGIPISTI